MSRMLSFTAAINEALRQAMEIDPHVICYGLGATDPKNVFGTLTGLEETFGPERVFDMPLSENAMTGIGIGAALEGIRPVMVHQRLDFFLLAMDQLVNNASKWHYMFGGADCVPLTIRLIIGRGWGQGPTHSQNLHAWFSHVPGLKVVSPSTPADAKGLLLASIFDNNPVIFLEHRWLHNTQGDVPQEATPTPIGSAAVRREGSDVTIVSLSYMTVEALHASEFLAEHGISCEVIDLRTLNPIDWPTVLASVRKTGRLLALDTDWQTCSVASEVVAKASMECWSELHCAPQRIALPDAPTPTSRTLTKAYYPRAEEIVSCVGTLLGRTVDPEPLRALRNCPHDVPGNWFTGPF